jgi:hypothetical protein
MLISTWVSRSLQPGYGHALAQLAYSGIMPSSQQPALQADHGSSETAADSHPVAPSHTEKRS